MAAPDAGLSDEEIAALDPATLLGGEIPFRPLGIAEMLDGAIAVIRRHPRAVLGLSLAISTVVQVINSLLGYYFIGSGARDELTPDPIMRSLGAQATLGALGLVLAAYGILLLAGLLAPVYGRALFGLPASLRSALRQVRPRWWQLIAVTLLLMGAALIGVGAPLAPLLALIVVAAPPPLIVLAGLVLVPLGVVTMVWLYVLYLLAVPAVVLERLTVRAALSRALRLSHGRWWRSFGTLLATTVITFFMGFVALRMPFIIVQLIFFGDDPTGTALLLSMSVDTLGRIVSWSLISPFAAGVIVLLYVDRRMRREGFDLELRIGRAPGANSGGPW